MAKTAQLEQFDEELYKVRMFPFALCPIRMAYRSHTRHPHGPPFR